MDCWNLNNLNHNSHAGDEVLNGSNERLAVARGADVGFDSHELKSLCPSLFRLQYKKKNEIMNDKDVKVTPWWGSQPTLLR